ncbi:hypothetical protein WR25_13242 [Diploscapter pachys]|uniref:Piwi domain-containing protein n=1 Tax=Diploscapter pachys TaxID=2018661 RepID=A0A2A2KX36_9BILA|nr:hypothetical protein WR25_13242 [Diploscapter pachys]
MMGGGADESRLGVNFKGESTGGARLPLGHRPRNGAAGEQNEGSEGSSSGSGFLGKTTITGTEGRKFAEGKIKEMGGKVGSMKEAPAPLPPKPDASAPDLTVFTNAFGLALPAESYTAYVIGFIDRLLQILDPHVYKCHVEVRGVKREQEYDFLEPRPDTIESVDSSVSRRCLRIWEYLLKNEDRLQRAGLVYYDGAHVIYSLMDFFAGTQQDSFTFTVAGKEAEDLSADQFDMIFFTVNKVEDSYQRESIMRHLAYYSSGSNSDVTFAELVLIQYCLNNTSEFLARRGKVYLLDGKKHGFTPFDCPVIDGHIELKIGMSKGIRLVQGPQGFGHVHSAVVIDTHKMVSQVEGPLLSLISEQSRMRQQLSGAEFELFSHLHDFRVESQHGSKKRRYFVSELANMNSLTHEFDLESQARRVTVEQYFRERYNIQLEFPGLPLLKLKRKKKSPTEIEKKNKETEEEANENIKEQRKILSKHDEATFHMPIELLWLVGNSGVALYQLCKAQAAEITSQCIVPPSVRRANIAGMHKTVCLSDENNNLIAGTGIAVDNIGMEVPARILQAPQIQYGCGDLSNGGAMWRTPPGAKYLIPAVISKWAIYYVPFQPGSGHHEKIRTALQLTERDIRSFTEKLILTCQSKGMNLPMPLEVHKVAQSDKVGIFRTVERSRKLGAQFAIFVIDEKLDLHEHLKMAECDFEVVTQELQAKTVNAVLKEGRSTTLENIVHKMNCKNGGLNNTIVCNPAHGQSYKSWTSPSRLYIGIVMSKEAVQGKSRPTCVGYCSNHSKEPMAFLGDFAFMPARYDNIILVAPDIVKTVIGKYMKEHGKAFPKEIVVYRIGHSDSSIRDVLHYELQLVDLTLSCLAAEHGHNKPLLQYIAASKQHSIRFFPQGMDPADKPPLQNLKAGSAIDEGVVNPHLRQFFLNSHTTLQGTSRTPSYTVLRDDLAYSMDELKNQTNCLAHLHQIVNLPTSLPSPLYIAGEYAKRGAMLLDQYMTRIGSIDAGRSIESLMEECLKLTRALELEHVPLFRDKRINA